MGLVRTNTRLPAAFARPPASRRSAFGSSSSALADLLRAAPRDPREEKRFARTSASRSTGRSVQRPISLRDITKRDAFPSDVPSSARHEHKRNGARTHMQHRAIDGREAMRCAKRVSMEMARPCKARGTMKPVPRASPRRLQIAGCRPGDSHIPTLTDGCGGVSFGGSSSQSKATSKTFAVSAIRARCEGEENLAKYARFFLLHPQVSRLCGQSCCARGGKGDTSPPYGSCKRKARSRK